MSPLRAVVEFSATRKPWQQDIMRRLYTQPAFSEEDFQEALLLLKAHHQVPTGEEEVPVGAPLSNAHIPYVPPDAPRIVLNSVGNVRHVNRLAEGQNLRFAINGMTVIYGDNGSGKSGYCRLLKRNCRVRAGGDERIYGNAFVAAAHPPAEARIRYTLGEGDVQEFDWRDGLIPPLELSAISVFDAKTAPIYADKENKIEFLPQGLDILPRLGEICKRLSANLDVEMRPINERLRRPLPALAAGTDTATVVGRLDQRTSLVNLPSEVELRALAEWNDQHNETLATVDRALGASPQSRAAQCRTLKLAITTLTSELETIETLLGIEGVNKLKKLVEATNTAKEAARLAATEAFKDDPLPGVGTGPWALMFKYAREYSKTAYPGIQFPATGADKLCLLCQQPLNEQASERLVRFEKYVQDAAQTDAERLERELEAESRKIVTLQIRAASDIQPMLNVLCEFDADHAEIIGCATAYLELLHLRREGIIKTLGGEIEFESIPEMVPSACPKLSSTVQSLDQKALEFDQLADPEERRRLETQKAALQSRHALSECIEQVIQRRNDLDLLARLNCCKSDCATGDISRKNTQLRREFFTDAFTARLDTELGLLGLTHLPFKVEDKSDAGASLLGVNLDATMQVQNSDILSDGEFRALALACFLTEVADIPGHSGIIVDDPVSSLDHIRTERVARRLVKEAQDGRQVIIFTHDLVFFNELYVIAAERGVPVTRHWIRHTEERGFGTIFEGQEPWQVKKVNPRINSLQEKIASVRAITDANGDEYRHAVKGFYTDLRETWEKLVEELLLNEVVSRFQLGVKTQSLKGATVEHDDYRRVYFGMARASEFSGHDRPGGRQVAFPTIDEMAADLEGLRIYAGDLRRRRTQLEDQRRALEQPAGGLMV